MREVCDLCGARWRPGAKSCHECGNTRSRMSGSQVTELPKPPEDESRVTAVDEPIDDYAPEPVTDPTSLELDRLVVEPQRRRSTLWLGLLVVGGALAAAAVMVLRTPAEPPAPSPAPVPVAPDDEDPEAERPVVDPCDGVEALRGTWAFTTEVTAAHALVYSGVRGFYEVRFDVDGCNVEASLTKTGYTGGFYSDRRVLRAKSQLKRESGPFELGFRGGFALRDASAEGPDQEFVFTARDDKLFGVWRQRGERWQTQGLAGFLEGEREPDGRVEPKLFAQPCEVRCSVACDTMRFEDLEALDGCVAECSDEEDELATCGEPLPPPLVLELNGPVKTLDEHCRRLTPRTGAKKKNKRKKKRGKNKVHCEKAPPTADGFAFALPEGKLDGGWREVRFVRTGPRDAPTVHLALRIPEGWYISSPLLEGDEAASLSDANVVARDLSDGEGRRHVFGFVAGSGSSQFVSCRLSESGPRCIRVPARGSTNTASALPGGGVAASQPLVVPDGEPGAPGPYSW